MEMYKKYRKILNDKLHEKNKITEHLAVLEQKTGVGRVNIVLGGGGSIVGLFMIFYGVELLLNLTAFLYPAYQSIKAIESDSKEDDTQWLMYWVVFGAFSVIEFWLDFVLCWLPFYGFFKCGFLVWCFLPIQLNGSQFVYYNIILPYFLKHKAEIESTLGQVKGVIQENVSEITAQATTVIQEKVLTEDNVKKLITEAASDKPSVLLESRPETDI